MKKFYFNVDTINLSYVSNLISNFEGKKLIISLVQENRNLESHLDVIDDIIYDNSDYLSGTLTLEEAIIEVKEDIDLLPSSYKQKVDKVDFNDFDLEFLNNYNYIFYILDGKLIYENIKEYQVTISNRDLNNEDLNYVFIGDFSKSLVKKYKVYGFINDNKENLNITVNNLVNNEFIEYKKRGILDRIKGLFS